MGIQARVTALKQHLEELFPGKLVSGQERKKTLATGLVDIDRNLPRGLSRQQITQWAGSVSSGKSTILRAVVANWCASGLSVAYIDVERRLMASDWAFVEQGVCGAVPSQMAPRSVGRQPSGRGRFWVVRPQQTENRGEPGEQRHARRGQDACIWTCEQLIRCNAFDVVILDLAEGANRLSSRGYARLQNTLAKSRAALIVLQDRASSGDCGCHCRLSFHWGSALRYEAGLGGIAMIVPTVRCSIWQNGLSQTAEVALVSHVSNRLFTHPPVPDRRTSEA